MRSSIRKYFAAYLFLCVAVPLIVSMGITYAWFLSADGNNKLMEAASIKVARWSLASILNEVNQDCDLLLQSRELTDYMHAAEGVRPFISNLLYARLASLQRRTPAIAGWAIYDRHDRHAFGYGQALAEPWDHRHFISVGQEAVYLTKKLQHDAQYIEQDGSHFFGYVRVSIPLTYLQAVVPSLKKIVAANDITPEAIDIETITQASVVDSLYVLLGFLLLTLVASMLSGFALLNAKVFRPIRQLTREVQGAFPDQEEVAYADKNEISVLRQTLVSYRTAMERQANLVAIAKTTQMIAHDIRKPFSQVKAVLQTLTLQETSEAFRARCQQFLPYIDVTMASVDRMLDSILDIGRSRALELETTQVESVVAAALQAAFLMDTRSRIHLHYDFSHAHALHVDRPKVVRMLSNLLQNATQAMGGLGDIWISSREQTGRISLSVRNSHSYLDAAAIAKLFDAFYSKRNGGVGLGLTIAKEVVEAHGGKITCTSSQEAGTSFSFDLPAAETTAATAGTEALPASTQSINASEKRKLQPHGHNPEVARKEKAIATRLAAHPSFVLAVVDDDDIYSMSIAELVRTSPCLQRKVQVKTAASLELASLASLTDASLLIVDIDLGAAAGNGFDVVRALRARAVSSYICMHSNRITREYFDEAVTAGANILVPKPMVYESLITMILAALDLIPPQAITPPNQGQELQGTLQVGSGRQNHLVSPTTIS